MSVDVEGRSRCCFRKGSRAKLAYTAMCDAFKATKINPYWPKGHYRYAKALEMLDRLQVHWLLIVGGFLVA